MNYIILLLTGQINDWKCTHIHKKKKNHLNMVGWITFYVSQVIPLSIFIGRLVDQSKENNAFSGGSHSTLILGIIITCVCKTGRFHQ